MNAPLLGTLVVITAHSDASIVGKFGRVTAVSLPTVHVEIQIGNKAQTRTVPIQDVQTCDNQ